MISLCSWKQEENLIDIGALPSLHMNCCLSSTVCQPKHANELFASSIGKHPRKLSKGWWKHPV